MTLELTATNFQQEVVESPVPVVVDFWSPTCGPCRRIAPLMDELAAQASGRYRVGKVHAYDQPDLAARYRISALPTLLFFRDGQVVQSLVGAPDRATLLAEVQQLTGA